jgi:predicted permease
MAAAAFLFGFYLLLVGSKIVVALLAARSRNILTGGTYRAIMRVLAFLLVIFAILLLREGFKQLRLVQPSFPKQGVEFPVAQVIRSAKEEPPGCRGVKALPRPLGTCWSSSPERSGAK